MPAIPYIPECFPPHTGERFQVGRAENFAWAELVHSAITVGRANWSDVLQHGNYSVLEILWRVAMLRANLCESEGWLAPTSAYLRLDRSEKGAVSFFLGLCTAKVFASRLLDVPWLLHLDVYRSRLNPAFNSAERPDFVGMDAYGRWIVVEAKGRTQGAPSLLLEKAKNQTASISAVGGQQPVLCIATAAYFSSGRFRARIRDPISGPVPIEIVPESLARAYYAQLFEFIKLMTPGISSDEALVHASVQGVSLPGLDARVGVSEAIARWYVTGELSWDVAVKRRRERVSRLAHYEELMKLREPERKIRVAELEGRSMEVQESRLQEGAFGRTSEEDSQRFTGGDDVTVELGPLWNLGVMELDSRERPG